MANTARFALIAGPLDLLGMVVSRAAPGGQDGPGHPKRTRPRRRQSRCPARPDPLAAPPAPNYRGGPFPGS
jgi:hypothetical protein